ncbi:TIR-like protein FxsC [Micromonospora sp. NPDC049559]|uniref:TIR-like protein FxsC n=1 Tax=Micromonospora sp. NPDC049559 TaxID=3155923 RepID=UPI0034227592
MPDDRVQVDPLAPLFFLSYAVVKPPRRSTVGPRDPNANVLELFAELSVHVNHLVSRPTGADPGFMDRTMRGGERWNAELLEAVGTCQVFVALLSPAYLDSEWCAMEWDAFASRKVHKRDENSSDRESCILPVSWSPMDSAPLPDSTGLIQRFSPEGTPDDSIVPQYQQEGLYGLLSMRQEVTHGVIVWKLAQRIVQLSRSHWVEPRVLTDTSGLARKFPREGL